MSTFISHSPCPNCGSKDNLGVWDDHKYCFGCGYYRKNRTTLEDVERSSQKIAEVSDTDLPVDVSKHFPIGVRKWLNTYELTSEETDFMLWSENREMLIFPFYDNEGDVIMWQGRYFPTRQPKVYTRGRPEDCIITLGPMSEVCVIVEDVISAIKVGRFLTGVPLFGANLSMQKARRLSSMFKKCVLWLDNDKVKEMVRFRERYYTMFEDVSIVVSDKDPKYYSTEDIVKYLC